MTSILQQISDNYDYYFNDNRDPRGDNLLLLGPPHQIAAVLFAYWYFVKKLGPNLMKRRKPFELKTAMIVYNAAQVVLNMLLACAGAHMMIKNRFSLACQPLDLSGSEQAHWEAFLTYCYFVMKLVDLMDTIFFVLRKKYNQVTFLHVYHHIMVGSCSYVMARYVPGGQMIMMGVVNSYVHVVMYFYYLLTCVRPEMKTSIAWKKKITQIQILQFAFMIVHFGRPLLYGRCTNPIFTLLIGLTQNVFMLALFSNFYFKAYLKKSKKSKQ